MKYKGYTLRHFEVPYADEGIEVIDPAGHQVGVARWHIGLAFKTAANRFEYMTSEAKRLVDQDIREVYQQRKRWIEAVSPW